jgi:NADPH-dependent 2,4-dienoyl-CoA reductase/sulfur reductase-like enzyme
MGTVVARNLKTNTTKLLGTQGTSAIKIYDLCIASTGLTVESARREGIEASAVFFSDNYRPEFMPTNENIKVKLVYESLTRKVIGAQIMSKNDFTAAINTISVCIQKGVTVDELAFMDFFFLPHFDKPWNFLNSAALSALPRIK